MSRKKISQAYFFTIFTLTYFSVGHLAKTLILENFLSSNKCLGGRCVLVVDDRLENDSDVILHANLLASASNSSIRLLPASAATAHLLAWDTSSPTKPDLLNPSNAVLLWPDLGKLQGFLSAAGGEHGWRGEHFVKMDESMDAVAAEMRDLGIALRIDSKVFLINGGVAYEVYGVSNSSTKTTHRHGVACRPWPCDPLKDVWHRRSDLTGVHLTAGYRIYPPNAQYIAGENPEHPDIVTGFFPEIFFLLRYVLNFTSSVVPSVDGSYGRRLPNGSFTGLVGMLQRREISVNIGSQTIRHDRILANDHSPPLLDTPLGVFHRSSGQYQLNMWQLLAVFDLAAWVPYVALFCLSLLVLFAILLKANPDERWFHSLGESTAFVGRTAILKAYQMSARVPKSGKVACIVFAALSIVMFAYLRAGLLSKLAVRSATLELHTLQDLLDHDMRVMLPMGGNIHATFASARPESTLGRLWAAAIQPHAHVTLRPGMGPQKALEFAAGHSDVAYVSFETTAKKSPLYPCQIRELDEKINQVSNALGYQKNWPLTEMFNFYLNQMRADGVIAKLWDRFYAERDVDCAADTDPELNYDTTFGVFLILLSGVAAAVVVLGAEVASGHRKLMAETLRNRRVMVRKETISNLMDLVGRERAMAAEMARLRSRVEQQERVIAELKGERGVEDVEGNNEGFETLQEVSLSEPAYLQLDRINAA